MTEWLMMKVMGSMPAIPEIITGWGPPGLKQEPKVPARIAAPVPAGLIPAWIMTGRSVVATAAAHPAAYGMAALMIAVTIVQAGIRKMLSAFIGRVRSCTRCMSAFVKLTRYAKPIAEQID